MKGKPIRSFTPATILAREKWEEWLMFASRTSPPELFGDKAFGLT
jgi:hypothetical protein